MVLRLKLTWAIYAGKVWLIFKLGTQYFDIWATYRWNSILGVLSGPRQDQNPDFFFFFFQNTELDSNLKYTQKK